MLATVYIYLFNPSARILLLQMIIYQSISQTLATGYREQEAYNLELG